MKVDNKVYKAECEKSWSRIAELVMERAEFVDRIAELELRLECCRDASTGKDLLIAELEAQLTKTAKAIKGRCTNCGSVCGYNFCQHCGAKLDWSEA